MDAHLFDLNKAETWHILDEIKSQKLDLYVLVPPSQIDAESFAEFVSYLRKVPVHKAILASSTVVYGNSEREVDADSKVEIDSVRGERQYAVEQLWRKLGVNTRIVRFAGLYGPGRIIGKGLVEKGESIPGLSEAWLNLIHVEDAAKLLIKVATAEYAQAVELGCDGKPVKRGEYYSDLARHLNCQPPVFLEDDSVRGRGRRCSNTLTIERTGWQPERIDYRDSFE